MGWEHGSGRSALTRATLIVNAVKADPEAAAALHETVTGAFAEVGWPKPEMLMTTPEDGGAGFARAALASGAELVVACGGDGTVNAVAGALAGTGAVLGVLSLGTGNLLAANLGIPGRLEEAVAVLIAGTDRRIDVGAADGDRVFVAMAGLGLDAAMIADTSEPFKARVGCHCPRSAGGRVPIPPPVRRWPGLAKALMIDGGRREVCCGSRRASGSMFHGCGRLKVAFASERPS